MKMNSENVMGHQMRIVDKLPSFNNEQLVNLEANARRRIADSTGTERYEAEVLLDAVTEEVRRRRHPDGLVIGKRYTREEIGDICGGNTVPYLPVVNGHIVCICLNPELNPEAPDVILAGDGPMIIQNAETLSTQAGRIPVFLKRASANWEYVGNYSVKDFSKDRTVINRYTAMSGRESDIRMVIFLEK